MASCLGFSQLMFLAATGAQPPARLGSHPSTNGIWPGDAVPAGPQSRAVRLGKQAIFAAGSEFPGDMSATVF